MHVSDFLVYLSYFHVSILALSVTRLFALFGGPGTKISGRLKPTPFVHCLAHKLI